MFLYYHKITLHATIVTTNDFFYVLNIQDEIKITCGKYNHETVREMHSVSIIKQKDICDCVIQTTEIQLIGRHSNCSSNENFIIYDTFNFVTEWLYNKLTMPYYMEKEHILRLPSQARIPAIIVIQSNTSNVFTKSEIPAISIHQLNALVNRRRKKDISLSHSDKNREDNILFNHSLEQNMDDNDEILDIDYWFDEDIQSSMIYIFISCIIALITFIILIFLCFKHDKVHFIWPALKPL